MINSSQARNLAEARWGRGGTNAQRTNRKGAYYFSCSGHGGMIIDARCLTVTEYTNMKKFIKPEIIEAVTQSNGKVRRLRGPDGRQALTYHPSIEQILQHEVFYAEEDCDWAVPAIVAGIVAGTTARQDAIKSFLAYQEVSNHDRVALGLSEGAIC